MALYIISSVDVFFFFRSLFFVCDTFAGPYFTIIVRGNFTILYACVAVCVCVVYVWCMFELTYIVQRTVFAVAVDGPPLN